MIHEAQSRRAGGPQGPGHRKMDVQEEATTAKRERERERELRAKTEKEDHRGGTQGP